MEVGGEIEQFELLEQKVNSLLDLIKRLRSEKDSLLEKVQIQEGKIGDLTSQLEELKAGRDKAKQRILQLLEKIEQLDL